MIGTRIKAGDRVRPVKLLAAALFLSLMAAGCAGEQQAPAAKPQAAPKAAQKAASAVPPLPGRDAPAIVEQESVQFDAKSMRDPFKPFIRIEKEAKSTKELKPVAFVPRTPLQFFAIEEIKFVGVVWSQGNVAQALLEDPSGKGYMVKTGTFVGNRGGKLKEIRTDLITIEEELVDVLGETNLKLTTIKLHKPENEVNQ